MSHNGGPLGIDLAKYWENYYQIGRITDLVPPTRSEEAERLESLLRQAIAQKPATAGSTSGASIPVKPTPHAGEQWWVKVPDQPRLELVRIKEISPVSVQVHVDFAGFDGIRSGRYERDYLKFVEKYVNPSLEPEPV